MGNIILSQHLKVKETGGRQLHTEIKVKLLICYTFCFADKITSIVSDAVCSYMNFAAFIDLVLNL